MVRGRPNWVGDVATEFEEAFPPRLAGPRKVGQESEYPLVTATGEAADASLLWPLLDIGDLQPKFDAVNQQLMVGLEGPDYGYALEVGRGTIEISTRPCQHLLELQHVHQVALDRLIRAATHLNLRVLGYGIQPLSPPTASLLSPKQRYHSLLQRMGDAWLWYTVTASEQLHVDVARPEMVPMLNFGLMMAPVIVAFCGNSSLYAGMDSAFCSAREGVAGDGPYGNRHGIPASAYTDLADFIERLSQLPFLLRRDGTALLPDHRIFSTVMEEGGTFADFLLHDHYVWHSARLRVAHATLEMRPACQQPPGESMAAAVLYLGLVEAADEIRTFLQAELGDQTWTKLSAYWQGVIVHGMVAPEPCEDFLSRILALVQTALRRRGYGEEALLPPLWKRLATRRNPAQQARYLFHQAGPSALLEFCTLRPSAG